MIPGLKTPDGALYVTNQSPAATDVQSGGVTMTANGWVHVNGNTPQRFDQGKGFMNNGDLCIDQLGGAVVDYVGGLPVTATGALKCQLNQPVSPGDAYVGGLRIGPLGGLYIVDAAPAWTPADLFLNGEQGAWYDPSDLSTMFQDSAGTTPVTADGQPVGKILDKSGRGNHAMQATAASRPLYKTDGTYHWLQFDGVDDYIKNTTASVSQPATYSIGTRPNTWAPNKYFYDGGTLDTVMMYQINGTPQVKPYAGVVPASSFNMPVGISSVVTNIYNGASSVSRCNGVQVLSETFGSSGCTGVTVGANGVGTGNLGGNIYSLIIRGALSTADEITATETWVNGKTGAF